MITYVMLSAGPNTRPTTLLPKEGYLDALKTNSFLLEGNPHVLEEFEACCWCEAMDCYNRTRGFGGYDMWDCHDQFDKGHIVCEFYFEMKARQDESED